MNKKPTVLMIDDEPDILQVVGILLKTEGFDVSVAGSGQEALNMMMEQSYDVVVSDFLMPYMDGISLLKKVRERKDFTPFIFFSGNADDSHELQMIGLGAYELLPKSELNSLKEVLDRTLKQSGELKLLDQSKTEDTDEFLKILHSVG